METIKSFLINHDAHPEGVYLSHAEHNIYTYDLRFKKPNAGDFLTTAAAHTVEHLFATVMRGQRQGCLFRADGLPHGLLSAYARHHA